jgi:SAM-dependent methyltransferase
MNNAWAVEEGQVNHLWLLQHFVDLLESFKPQSVLDVGCGAGGLLKACSAAGITVQGLDQGSPRLDALVAEGFDVIEGSAYELPLEADSVDWVTLRHVPHHLDKPELALAEALRVSRCGVLCAEPCFDESLACQRSAVALDVWEKQQHRREGMYHAEVLSLGELLALLPQSAANSIKVQVHTHFHPRGRDVTAFEVIARQLVESLPAEHEHQVALNQLLPELHRTGLSWNGSMCLVLTHAR